MHVLARPPGTGCRRYPIAACVTAAVFDVAYGAVRRSLVTPDRGWQQVEAFCHCSSNLHCVSEDADHQQQ